MQDPPEFIPRGSAGRESARCRGLGHSGRCSIPRLLESFGCVPLCAQELGNGKWGQVILRDVRPRSDLSLLLALESPSSDSREEANGRVEPVTIRGKDRIDARSDEKTRSSEERRRKAHSAGRARALTGPVLAERPDSQIAKDPERRLAEGL